MSGYRGQISSPAQVVRALERRVEALERRAAGGVPADDAFAYASGNSGAFANGAIIHSFTLDVAGFWVVAGGVGNYAFAGGTRRGLRLLSGGATVAQTFVPLVSNDTGLSAASPFEAEAGDVLQLQTFHDAGGSLNHNTTFLAAVLVRAT